MERLELGPQDAYHYRPGPSDRCHGDRHASVGHRGGSRHQRHRRDVQRNGGSPWTIGVGVAADRVMAWTSHDIAAPSTYYVGLRNGGVMKSVDAGVNWTQMNAGVYERVPGVPYFFTANAVAANPSITSEVYGGFEGVLPSQIRWHHLVGALRRTAIPTDQSRKASSTRVLQRCFIRTSIFRVAFTGATQGLHGSCGKPARSPAPASGLYAPETRPGDSSRFRSTPCRTYRTTRERTWLQIPVSAAPSSGFMRLAFQALADKPSQPSTLLGSTNKGLYRSTDGGASFTRISASGLGSNLFTGLAYSSSNIAWGATRDGALYCSANDGANWVSVTQPFPAVVTQLLVRGSTLFLLTDGAGMLRRSGATCP